MKRLGFNVGVEYFSATRTDSQQFLMGDGHWVLRNGERTLDRGAVDIGTKPNRPRLQINRRLSRRQRPIAGSALNLTNLYNRNGSRRSRRRGPLSACHKSNWGSRSIESDRTMLL